MLLSERLLKQCNHPARRLTDGSLASNSTFCSSQCVAVAESGYNLHETGWLSAMLLDMVTPPRPRTVR